MVLSVCKALCFCISNSSNSDGNNNALLLRGQWVSLFILCLSLVSQTQRHTGACLVPPHPLLTEPWLNLEKAFLCCLHFPLRTPLPLVTSSLSCGFSAEGAVTAAWSLMMNLLVQKRLIMTLPVALMGKRNSWSWTRRSRSASRVWKARQKMKWPQDRHAAPGLWGGSTFPASQQPTAQLCLWVQQHLDCTVGSRAVLCEQGCD